VSVSAYTLTVSHALISVGVLVLNGPAARKDAQTSSLANFNFRTVTGAFNELVYQYPIRIPERFSLVIRSLLTQEGICMTLQPDFRFLEVAYPYVAGWLSSTSSMRSKHGLPGV